MYVQREESVDTDVYANSRRFAVRTSGMVVLVVVDIPPLEPFVNFEGGISMSQRVSFATLFSSQSVDAEVY